MTRIHQTQTDLSGKIVKVKPDIPIYGGLEVSVTGWWDWIITCDECYDCYMCKDYAQRAHPEGNDIVWITPLSFDHNDMLFHVDELTAQ